MKFPRTLWLSLSLGLSVSPAALARTVSPDSPSAPPPLFTSRDYPAEARRQGWQGKVIADVTVGVDGRPTACKIVKSSGYAILDERTCDILRTRPRFVIAHDEKGMAIEQTLRTPPITWALNPH